MQDKKDCGDRQIQCCDSECPENFGHGDGFGFGGFYAGYVSAGPYFEKRRARSGSCRSQGLSSTSFELRQRNSYQGVEKFDQLIVGFNLFCAQSLRKRLISF